MEQVEVIKQLYKKSEKPIEIMDEKGDVKKMTQIIREKSGTMKFSCNKSYYKKHLIGNPDYSLADKKAGMSDNSGKANKAEKAE